MSPATFVILSGSLTFGAPLILAVRELFVLRRPPSGPGWGGSRLEPAGPRAPKPLPDCLVPKPWPGGQALLDRGDGPAAGRRRMLEDA